MNKKNKHNLVYPNVPSARKPVPQCSEVPIPKTSSTLNLSDDSDESIEFMDDNSPSYIPAKRDVKIPIPLSQAKLNYLVRDLNQSKHAAQILGSRFESVDFII